MIKNLTLAIVIGLAKQYRKDEGQYRESGFKPNWKNVHGVTFTAFCATFGYVATFETLKPYSTRFGFVDCHLTRSASAYVEMAGRKAPVVVNARPVVTKAPRSVKPATTAALSIDDFNLADLRDLVKAGKLRFKQ